MFKEAVEKIRNIAFRNNKEIYDKLVKKDEMKNFLSSMKWPFYLSIIFAVLTSIMLLQVFGDIQGTFLGFILFVVWLFLFNGMFVCAFVKLQHHENYCKSINHIQNIKKQIDLSALKNQHLSLDDLKTLKDEIEFIKNDLSEDELFKVLKITKEKLEKDVGDLAFFEYLFSHYYEIKKQGLNSDEIDYEFEHKDLARLFNLFKKISQ